jgi:ABC-type amino acid transport substrate-binding protein
LGADDLAWGIQPGNPILLAQVNKVLAKWKTDGTLNRTLNRWMPYLKNRPAQQPAAEQPK